MNLIKYVSVYSLIDHFQNQYFTWHECFLISMQTVCLYVNIYYFQVKLHVGLSRYNNVSDKAGIQLGADTGPTDLGLQRLGTF